MIDERHQDNHGSDSVHDSSDPNRRSSTETSTAPLQLASSVVVGCRVRLARNIAEFPFLEVCSNDQRAEIETAVRASLRHHDRLNRLTVLDCQLLEMMEHQFLTELQSVVGLSRLERHSSHSRDANHPAVAEDQSDAVGSDSNDLQNDETAVGGNSEPRDAQTLQTQSPDAELVELTEDQFSGWKGKVSLLLNEEDHLRLQVFHPGAELVDAWQVADQLDDLIEQKLNFAFSPQLGYLTACPANVGTGLRVSVVLHLPALVLSGEIHDWLRKLARSNVMGREVFGDPAGGDFYRFSNQATLGCEEAKLVRQVAEAIPELVAAERKARDRWLERDRDGLQAEVTTALQQLSELNFEDATDNNRFEMTRLLSQVRLGLETGLLGQLQTAEVAGKFEIIQLQEQLTVAVTVENYHRASQVRDRIKFLEGDSE